METVTKTKWVIDPAHTEIQFKVKHLVISTVTGQFDKFDGFISSGSENFNDLTAEFRAEVNSINTNQPDRDLHLKSADFFDAANFPYLSFQSTGIKRKEENSFLLTGDLTMRGVTKKIDLDVEYGGSIKDPWGNIKAGFSINGKINRKDFGLHWNAVTEAGGVVVADEIKLSLNVEVTKQS